MTDKDRKRLTALIVAGVIVLLALIVIVPSVHIIPTGEVGAVRRFGVVTEVLQPGLHLRLPFINTVDRYETITLAEIITFTAHTTDAQSVSGYVTVQYRIDPMRVIEIANEYGQLRQLSQRLNEVFQNETQNVFATKSAMDLVQHRALLAPEIRERLIAIQEQYFVIITMVTLEEMNFSEEFERSIEMVAIADQERRRAEEEVARQIQLAEGDLAVARLQADAEIVRAEADARALVIMQEAWGDLGAEVREIMLRQQAIGVWDGVLPSVIGGGDFSLILDNFTTASNPNSSY